MTDFEILVPQAKAMLRDTACRLLAFDPDLAATLNDMAAEYAGPYIEKDAS